MQFKSRPRQIYLRELQQIGRVERFEVSERRLRAFSSCLTHSADSGHSELPADSKRAQHSRH
eukprot:11148998-Lingulodinium_polyedra.AAC.1